MPNVLVVCSDERAGVLGKSLGRELDLFRRWNKNGVWKYSHWVRKESGNKEGWRGIDDGSVPKSFDCLFFHTGQGDPAGIPEDCSFSKQFAFSGGGVQRGSIARGGVIEIPRNFTKTHCPVKERHIPVLVAYLAGGEELPAFCREGESVPALWALAIVTKAYAVAGIAKNAIGPNDALIGELGWASSEMDIVRKMSSRLAGLWSAAQEISWWQAHLGYGGQVVGSVSEYRYRRYLGAMIVDVELDNDARAVFGDNWQDERTGISPTVLLGFLGKYGAVANIVRLLSLTQVGPADAAAAYRCIKALTK